MGNFGCLNDLLFLFRFHFVTNTFEKKIMAYVRLQLNIPPPSIRVSTFLARPLLPCPSVRTLWMPLEGF